MTSEVERKLKQQQRESQKYRNLVNRIERQARANPQAFKSKLVLLGALGYAYIGLLLAVAAGFVCLFAYSVYFGLLGLYMAYLAVAALFVRLKDDDDGIELARNEAPRLFDEVDRMASELGSGSVHRVVVDFSVNASASELPRLGVLGWYRRTLRIGLPLLIGLADDELRAIIAHEAGHFSGRHGRGAVRIYRLSVAWIRLWYAATSQRSLAVHLLVLPFARWYSTTLSAHASVFSRANEVEADEYAKRISSQAMAMGLVKVGLIDKKHDRFVKSVHKMVADLAEPPSGFSRMMEASMAEPLPMGEAEGAIRAALAKEIDPNDTHPCLADRLRFAGVGTDIRTLAEEANRTVLLPAYRHYLENPDAVFARIDALWRTIVGPQWLERRKAVAEAKAKLEQLRSRPEQSPAWFVEEASLVETVEGEEAARQLKRAAYERWPDDGAAAFMYGVDLLEQMNPEGVEILKKAAKLVPQAAYEAYGRLAAFHRLTGDFEAMRQCLAVQERASAAMEVAEDEASAYKKGDVFVPHRLSESQLERVKASLASVKGIETLYIARKVLKKAGVGDILVVAVVPSGRHYAFRLTSDSTENHIRDRVLEAIELPETFMVFGIKARSRMAKALREVPGSLIPLDKPGR